MRIRAMSGRQASDLTRLDLNEHLDDPQIKQRYVTTLFDLIAPGYDAFTWLFSFGMDRRWKARLLDEVELRTPRDAVLVDVACGTGDLVRGLVSRQVPRISIGLDASKQMLALARNHHGDESAPIHLCGGDMHALAIRTGSVDVVTMGYGLRNAPSVEKGLSEIKRVLRPGGIFANLDFYQPENTAWRTVFLSYLAATGSAAGWLWHRAPATYGYIASSIRRYMTMSDFEEELAECGLVLQARRSYLGGGIGVHLATTPGATVGGG